MSEKSIKETDLYESRFGFKERNSTFRYYLVLLALFLLVLSTRIYFTTVYSGVVVDGLSMYPTLSNEQHLLMRPVNERHKADYGDVIVVYVGNYSEFQSADAPDYLIKRLIAKGGDNVKCTDGQVYVQYGGVGEFVAISEPYAYYKDGKEQYDFDTYEVGAGEIFFLGDNRQNSTDSRYYEYPSGSRLKKKLYKEEDIYGIVPEWAIERHKLMELFFFPSEAFSGRD